MKKLALTVFIFINLFFGTCFSQEEYIRLSAGVGLPVGNFSKLNNQYPMIGAAKPGPYVGVDIPTFGMLDRKLWNYLKLSFFYFPIKSDVKELLSNQIGYEMNKVTPYFLIPLETGFRYDFFLYGPKINCFVNGGIAFHGALGRIIQYNDFNDEYFTETYSPVYFKMGYTVGAGINVSDGVIFGLEYFIMNGNIIQNDGVDGNFIYDDQQADLSTFTLYFAFLVW